MVVFIDRDTQKVHNFPLEPATKKGVAKALQMFADALGENKGKIYLDNCYHHRDLMVVVVERQKS